MPYVKSHDINGESKDVVTMASVQDQEPDILNHGARIARNTVDKWRQFKHRRAAKCAENHKFANG